MMTTQILIILLLLAILAVVTRLTIDLRAIRFGLLIEPPGRPPYFPFDPHIPMVHSHLYPAPDCFAVWIWRGGQWALILEDLPPGVNPGPAPAWPGSYEGDRVRTWIPGRRP
jgi:hypothetical protein